MDTYRLTGLVAERYGNENYFLDVIPVVSIDGIDHVGSPSKTEVTWEFKPVKEADRDYIHWLEETPLVLNPADDVVYLLGENLWGIAQKLPELIIIRNMATKWQDWYGSRLGVISISELNAVMLDASYRLERSIVALLKGYYRDDHAEVYRAYKAFNAFRHGLRTEINCYLYEKQYGNPEVAERIATFIVYNVDMGESFTTQDFLNQVAAYQKQVGI